MQCTIIEHMSQNDLIGSAEACSILGHIDRSTLSRWVAAGRITPAKKLPGIRGAYLFRRLDVEALRERIAAEEVPAP